MGKDVKINILDKDTINKIAAGEVIERPASVVKELVDNSLDAGAKAIWIDLKKSGKEEISVRDDGSGMSRENVILCPIKHATSKISAADDLEVVKTMGFRGEALSSIGSVAKMEIITKRKDDLTGAHLIVESGKEDRLSDIGASDGTTVLVHDLFSNVPVRKKYLKTDATELSHITKMVTDLILANNDVSFYLTNNGKKIISSASSDLFNSIVDTLGEETARMMIPIKEKTDGEDESEKIKVEGYISKPEFNKTNSSFMYFIVNGRPVYSKELNSAVRLGYYTKIPKGMYPACVLKITLPSEDIDVNVHPRKTEIRFSNEKEVTGAIIKAIEKTLEEVSLSPKLTSNEAKMISTKSFSDYGINVQNIQKTEENTEKINGNIRDYEGRITDKNSFDRIKPTFKTYENQLFEKQTFENRQNKDDGNYRIFEEPLKRWSGKDSEIYSSLNSDLSIGLSDVSNNISKIDRNKFGNEFVYPAKDTERRLKYTERLLRDGPEFSKSGKSLPKNLRVLGLVGDLYIIAETVDKGFVIIDQHAAHERIIYDILCDNTKEKTVQELIEPVVLNLSAAEKVLMEEYIPYIEEAGFGVSEFGDKSYIVSFVPAIFERVGDLTVIHEIISEILSEGSIQKQKDPRDEIMKTISCRAAIKAGARTTNEQMYGLISQLGKTTNPYSCPHGRPTIITFSGKELEKLFERT